MARKKEDLNMDAAYGFVSGEASQEDREETQDEAKRAGTSTLVSFRIDDEILRRFRGFSVFSGGTQIEAIERIISDYLDGNVFDPDEREQYEAFMSFYKGKRARK